MEINHQGGLWYDSLGSGFERIRVRILRVPRVRVPRVRVPRARSPWVLNFSPFVSHSKKRLCGVSNNDEEICVGRVYTRVFEFVTEHFQR